MTSRLGCCHETAAALAGAGYAACFESALRLVAHTQKRSLDEVEVTAQVTLGQDDSGAFQIAVVLHGRIFRPRALVSVGRPTRIARSKPSSTRLT